MSNLQDKVTIITGASSGIGAATAKALAAKGAKVVLAARSADKLDALKAEIEAVSGTALAVTTDVTKPDDLKALVAEAEKAFGPVDNLVNNAGLMLLGDWDQVRTDDWSTMVDTNIHGYLNAIAAVLPGMIERRAGRIVNMASIAGHHAQSNAGVYSATKFFIHGMTESMRSDLGPKYGLGISAVSPGTVATGWDKKVRDDKARDEATEMTAKLGIEAEQIADAVVFALDRPAHVTTSDIIVNTVQQAW